MFSHEYRSMDVIFESQLGHVIFVEIDHEMISMVVLLLSLRSLAILIMGFTISCIYCSKGLPK